VIAAALLCVAVVAGVSWWRVLLLAAVLTAPLLVAVAMTIVVWRSRGSEDDRTILFCEGVASELRAGATLRDALSTAVVSLGGAPPALDSSLDEFSAELAARFDGIGEELRSTIPAAARSGSAAAAIFGELGSLALAQSEIRHEVRIATAPGRASAMVFIGAPLTFVVSRLVSGEAQALLASPQQRLVTLLGLGIFLVGLTVVALVVWRARP
jgi:Flp pilus assembly protein TadB